MPTPTCTLNPLAVISPPASPDDLTPDTSLADLRRIKAQWIALAEEAGDFAALALVAREFTTPGWVYPLPPLMLRHTYPGAVNPRQADLDGLTVYTCDHFSIGPDRHYHLTTTHYILETRLDRPTLVCHFRHTDDGQTRAELFIPGPWVNTFRLRTRAARERQQARYRQAQENERQALLAELGIS